jgi:hypothetical protein
MGMSRILRGAAACVAATALLLAAGTAASAAAGGLGPEPPGGDAAGLLPVPFQPPTAVGTPSDSPGSQPDNASASGLGVTPLGICFSCTDAGSGNAGASAVRVLGADVAGGRSRGEGAHSGELVAAPANPLLTLAIAKWIAETRANRSSHANATLVELVILPHGHDTGGTATVCVIDTASDAGNNGKSASSGDAVKADAADGAVMVALAHSNASSDGMGSAYVVGLNKQELISSEQSGSEIPVKIPGVDTVVVHHRAGDPATEATVAQAGTASGQQGQGQIADAVTTSAVAASQGASTLPSAAETPITGGGSATAGAVGGRAPGIPGTGGALGVAGVALLLVGVALMAASMRRRCGVTGSG